MRLLPDSRLPTCRKLRKLASSTRWYPSKKIFRARSLILLKHGAERVIRPRLSPQVKGNAATTFLRMILFISAVLGIAKFGLLLRILRLIKSFLLTILPTDRLIKWTLRCSIIWGEFMRISIRKGRPRESRCSIFGTTRKGNPEEFFSRTNRAPQAPTCGGAGKSVERTCEEIEGSK